MNPKYHIARRKYVVDIFKAISISFFVSIAVISLFFENGDEEINQLTNE